MEKRSIEAIVGALNAAHVRYLIAGGLAVIAHGHVRLTQDVDLIVDFETSNLQAEKQNAIQDNRGNPERG